MAKDLSDIDVSDDNLSPEQKRLMLWRDYFNLLLEGIVVSDNGQEDTPWTEKEVKIVTWLKVARTEFEGDVIHLECGQEKYCRWGDAKDLSEIDGNMKM